MPSSLRSTLSRVLAASACALALAACSDRGDPVSAGTPAQQAPQQPSILGSVRCLADTRAKTLSCGAAELPSSARGYIIVGGQHDNLNLTSSNVAYDGTSAFTFDVTVQNLIPQAMGTTDGVTPDANGVRVIFASGPTVTAGSGNASVANADGTGTFTNTNQPYFQYSGTTDLGADGLLTQNETSGARNWQLSVDNTVTSFAFTLYVVTEVQFPNGWIDVAGATPNVLSGGSEALTATVRQPTGKLAGSQSITWASTNTSVATVDASGNVTAVAPGSAVITATQGGLSKGTPIAVCPNLAVGQAYVAGSDAASICFAGGASGKAEYTYMPMNLSQSSSLPSFAVTGGVGIDSALVRPLSPSPDKLGGVAGLPLRPLDVVAGSDLGILEKDLPKMNALLKNPSSRVRSGRRTGGFRGIITQNVVPSVGDSMDLNTNSACSGSPSVRRGVVRSVSQHLVIVSDTANPAGGFTTAQYDSIALEFDTIAWKVDSTNFGPPTDVDGNHRVVAFFTRAVNELTPPNNSSYVLGFFASKDVFSNDPVNGCTNSNMGEMFYMLVPDPTGAVNSNVRTVSLVRGNTTGTLGHEFQHMINAFRRAYVTNADFFEQGFLNEGLSHIAEELMFYRASGMSPRVNIKLGTDATSGIQLNSKRVSAFNAYANQNFSRFRGWITRPDTTGAFKQNPNSLAVRGAIWAFLRYSADRVNGNDQTFWYNLVNSNLEGLPNIQNAIGGADPNTWLRDFIAAIYADDNTFTVATQYRTPSWNYRSMYSALGGFSVPTQTLNNGLTRTFTYGSGGSTNYMRFAVASGAFGTVTTSTLPGTPFAVLVVRTR